jgi:hypothetical protein
MREVTTDRGELNCTAEMRCYQMCAAGRPELNEDIWKAGLT